MIMTLSISQQLDTHLQNTQGCCHCCHILHCFGLILLLPLHSFSTHPWFNLLFGFLNEFTAYGETFSFLWNFSSLLTNLSISQLIVAAIEHWTREAWLQTNSCPKATFIFPCFHASIAAELSMNQRCYWKLEEEEQGVFLFWTISDAKILLKILQPTFILKFIRH